jgi:hypothetical protein
VEADPNRRYRAVRHDGGVSLHGNYRLVAGRRWAMTNTISRMPAGALHCDVLEDADGFLYHMWRPATAAEARAIAHSVSIEQHECEATLIFGYNRDAFLARQYR